MKHLYLLTALAASLFVFEPYAVSDDGHHHHHHSSAPKKLVEISYTKENPNEPSYEWEKWEYAFRYDNEERVNELMYSYGNYYEYSSIEYTSRAIITGVGNAEDGEYHRGFYHLWNGRPLACTNVSFDGLWPGDEVKLVSDGTPMHFVYNEQGQLIKTVASDGKEVAYTWKDGNLVSIGDEGYAFEYGTEENKIGPLAYAMPLFLRSIYSFVGLDEYIILGISPKNLPTAIISGKEKKTINYTFNKEGYPVKAVSDDGMEYSFFYK